MKRRLNVLVACERSGKVREAFRKRGHNAWSCDLIPADDDSLYHLKEDVLGVIRRADLCGGQWDLMIAHPPCTYLCNSGVCWLWSTGGIDRRWNIERGAKMKAASKFFHELWAASIPHIAIENPIPHKYAKLGKYTQIIQPYMFGHPESKATCLWLKNLPKLTPTNDVKAVWKSLPHNKRQRLHYLSPGPERARIRSETFQGIADAMAEQWSNYIINER